jgi:hypothetical protein
MDGKQNGKQQGETKGQEYITPLPLCMLVNI